MYIIFHEPAGKTIITDDRKEKFDVYNLKGMNIEYIDADVDQVFPSADNIIRVYTTPDVDKLKINYLADKPSIVAAGGMVFNPSGDLLMMIRKGMWDMPKGKLDEGESIDTCAKREVTEETGLSSISIGEKLSISYHTYFYNDQLVVKPSHWYKMNFTGIEIPKPQIEEDITEIRWVKKDEARKLLDSMFPSIQEMIIRFYLKD
jgi:8-oxo-dGTP pyrophosphatase MutT (NUDIX family)